MARANPVEVEKSLKGIDFPAKYAASRWRIVSRVPMSASALARLAN